MTDRERIEELATAIVCPMNLYPSTPYELGMVKQYTNFALMVIEQLGYTKEKAQTRQDTLREMAKIMRALENMGQLNVRDFPLVTALVESCERGELPKQSGT